MLPTPSTSHASFDNIYEPAEDSYLLLDTLSSKAESTFLTKRFRSDEPSPLILEVGVGSGVVLAFVAANAQVIFGRSDVAVLGVDINPFAVKAAAQTIDVALKDLVVKPITLGTVMSDLTSSLRSTQVDALIFNPPYVPTEPLPAASAISGETIFNSHEAFDRDSKLLELSYAGGVDGMETTNRLLNQLPIVLSGRGVAYVLLCAQNKPEEVKTSIRLWPGSWNAETVGSSGKTAGWEKLCVVRIWRDVVP
ncbi:S-adenosylmethionine-dependent methyltransferase [Oleoguttula sp. CCFEE 5521]